MIEFNVFQFEVEHSLGNADSDLDTNLSPKKFSSSRTKSKRDEYVHFNAEAILNFQTHFQVLKFNIRYA